MSKRLYRSANNRIISGVCAGLGEYLGVDPTVVRLVWVIASVFPGFGLGGLIAYLVCALIIPQAPDVF